MIEGLFAITSVFVAYVVYQVINEPKPAATDADESASQSETTEPAATAVEDVAAPAEAAPAAEDAAAPVEAAPAAEDTATPAEAAPAAEDTAAPAEAAAAAEDTAAKPGLKNPKTGEVVLVYNNYRFAKRWVKEALVTEGLLDKIYKNNELNANVESKIKTAIAKLETIDKYRP
jgi:cell pole-organizing protein PopZ